MQENARKWQAPVSWAQKKGPGAFLKAQKTVSEVFGRQRLNTAAFCVIVACTKSKLQASIFKTSGTPI